MKAAKLALIVGVPATFLQLVVGNRFGEAVTTPAMKIAASEAQWDTCQPCGFSLVQIGGFTVDDQTPTFSITVPRLLSYMATGSFDGEVQGLNELQAQEESQYGADDYIPPDGRVLVDAGDGLHGDADGPRLRGRSLALLEGDSGVARWFHWAAIVAIAFPYIAATAGWILTEMGRQPWIVQGLLKTADAHSPSVSSTMLAFSLAVFVGLYVLLLVLDIWLMRRYATLDPPELGGEEAERPRCPRSDTEWIFRALVLPDRLLLRGVLPARGIRPRRRAAAAVPGAQRGGARHDVPHDRPSVGRQRGVARDRRRIDVRGLPDVVRDDVLRLLHRPAAVTGAADRARAVVRVARTERALPLARPLGLGEHDRQPRHRPDLGRRVLEPALRRADQLERRLRRHILGPLQSVHAARRRRRRAAVRVPRGDLPHPAHDRRAVPARCEGVQVGSRSPLPSSEPAI